MGGFHFLKPRQNFVHKLVTFKYTDEHETGIFFTYYIQISIRSDATIIDSFY